MYNYKVLIGKLDRGFSVAWASWDDNEPGTDGEEPKTCPWLVGVSGRQELDRCLSLLANAIADEDSDIGQVALDLDNASS